MTIHTATVFVFGAAVFVVAVAFARTFIEREQERARAEAEDRAMYRARIHELETRIEQMRLAGYRDPSEKGAA